MDGDKISIDVTTRQILTHRNYNRYSGTVVHHKVRWSNCVVVVDDKFIVIQTSTNGCHENLIPGQDGD